LQAITATGAQRVIVTHGNEDALIRLLREQHGLQAEALATEFNDEHIDAVPVMSPEVASEATAEPPTPASSDAA
jgi:putative mRNA 3-end processing factor